MPTCNFVAYNTASANWIARAETADAARKIACDMMRDNDEFLVIFDCGASADHIVSEMRSHRLAHNLRGCPVVWRGANDLAQRAFAQEDRP